MKKRIAMTLSIAYVMVMLVMGCAEKEIGSIDESYNGASSVEPASEEAETPSDPSDSDDASSKEISVMSASDLSDDAFSFNGKEVSILSDIKTLNDALGKPIPGYIFKDKDLTYYSFGKADDDSATVDMTTYTNGEKEAPLEIILHNDSVQTSKGIKVGDTPDAVTSAYGEPSKKDEAGNLTYDFDGFQLFFQIYEGKVVHIYYYNIAVQNDFYKNK